MTDAELLAWLRSYAAAAELRDLSPDALWGRVRAADPVAFRVLVERLGPRVYQICYAVLSDRHLAEDAFQDTFLLLARRRDRIDSFAKARAWARTAAGLVAGRHRRTRRRKAGRERPLADVLGTPPDARPEPDETARVTAALVELPDRYRRPLELVYWDGLTHAEAANQLGWTKGTVDSYVARGLKKLRAKLGPAAVAAGLTASAPPVPAAAFARLAGPLPAAGGWGIAKLAAVGLLLLGGAAVGAGAWGPAPALPPPAPPAPETLPAKNLRLFEADVRPRLQAALDGMAAGDGGRAVLTAVEAHGPRVWVSAELRHGPPQTHVTRLELVYDTHSRQRRFFEDTLGWFRTVNPDHPLTVARTRLGLPDLTRPTTGLRDALAAFHRLPPDSRTVAARQADRAAVRAVLGRHVGEWGGGRVVDWAAGWYQRDGGAVTFRGGPIRFCYWQDLRLRADGSVVGFQADAAGPFVFSADGRRIDWGGHAGDWVRGTTNGGE